MASPDGLGGIEVIDEYRQEMPQGPWMGGNYGILFQKDLLRQTFFRGR